MAKKKIKKKKNQRRKSGGKPSLKGMSRQQLRQRLRLQLDAAKFADAVKIGRQLISQQSPEASSLQATTFNRTLVGFFALL